MIDATAVQLVCEILSPSNSATDKGVEMHYYAEAGIPWYLVVDPTIGMLNLYRLDVDKYLDHATATPSELLHLTEPVAVSIDPADLLPPG